MMEWNSYLYCLVLCYKYIIIGIEPKLLKTHMISYVSKTQILKKKKSRR